MVLHILKRQLKIIKLLFLLFTLYEASSSLFLFKKIEYIKYDYK